MTYASHRIRGTLLDWARSMMPGGGRSKHTRDVRLIQFGDVEGEFPDQKILSGFNQIDLEDSVNRVLGQIPSKKHRDLLEMIYLKNQTGVQISRVWKCSEGWVSQMKLEALELARSGTR
jgi:DNA-directed RNA polymerase specialized sigma subunit